MLYGLIYLLLNEAVLLRNFMAHRTGLTESKLPLPP